jgi:hypothetical protein
MPVEMSLVDFVLQTLINCGNRALVVNTAAIKPMIITMSMRFWVLLYVELYLGFAEGGRVQTKIAIIRVLR